MISTVRVSANNSHIANDYYKSRLNNTEYTRSKSQYYTKQMSRANKTKEESRRKYESRKNVCDVCYTTKSVLTNECLCD